MKKKVITFLMAVLLVMSSVPIPAEAAEPSGTENLIEINEENFPDQVFRDYLSDIYDSDGDGQIDPNKVTRIHLDGEEEPELQIKSLKGIELFPNLTDLTCCYLTLTSLDVSKNPKLEELWCQCNQLTSLDISKNPKLELMSCACNQLTSLNVSENPNLKSITCSYNQLTSLDVSKNPNLEWLSCDDNQLTSLDVSKNPNLEWLWCYSNKLTRLDLSNNMKLEYIYCDFDSDFKELILPTEGNNLRSLDLWNIEQVVDLSKIKGVDFSSANDSRFDKTMCTLDLTESDFSYLTEEDDENRVEYTWYTNESGLPFSMYFIRLNASPRPFTDVSVFYRTHVQSIGRQPYVTNGEMAGTEKQAKRLEGINIRIDGNSDLGVQYTTHVQSYGWLPWSSNDEMSGTEGEAKRLEAIKIQLTGADKDEYDVYYRVHAQSYGWLGWAMNGAPAGTAGYGKRLEGIQILVVKKGEIINQNLFGIKSTRNEAYIALAGSSPVVGAAATSNTDPSIGGASNPNVSYRTHVQSFGWQGWKYNGQMSGTSGQAKRLEGINIKLTNKPYSGGICYTTHVQSIGWQGDINNSATWKKDGEMAGTSGQAKRLEAIMIKLTGEMADHYDVYYRVHAQSYGWLGWAKNGDPAGTAGYAKRLEGIQIVLVPKGGAAPSNSYGGITSANGQAYIAK